MDMLLGNRSHGEVCFPTRILQSLLLSDGAGESPLVSLVYLLTQLSQSPHQRVAHEAGRCLAEIGPTDLHTVAIKGHTHKVALSKALSLYDDDQQQQRYCELFHLLDDCLNDSRCVFNSG